MSTFPSIRRVAPVVVAVGLLGAACGEDAGGVEAAGAWARTSPMNADAGAAYMTLSSEDAVSIVSASVPAEVAGTVEMHETIAMEMDEGSMDEDMEEGMDDESMEEASMDDDSMEEGSMDEDGHSGETPMSMSPVSSIDIPAGGQAVLEPGGLHLMLLDLPDPLESGETFEVTLTTDAGDEITVEVEVRDDAP